MRKSQTTNKNKSFQRIKLEKQENKFTDKNGNKLDLYRDLNKYYNIKEDELP